MRKAIFPSMPRPGAGAFFRLAAKRLSFRTKTTSSYRVTSQKLRVTPRARQTGESRRRREKTGYGLALSSGSRRTISFMALVYRNDITGGRSGKVSLGCRGRTADEESASIPVLFRVKQIAEA